MPGNLPMRCFVAISQADAALMKMPLASSAIAVRATAESAASPESHQSRAWVSSSSCMLLFPRCLFLLRQGFGKFRSDADDSMQRPEPAPGQRRLVRHEFGDRLLATRQDDLLTGFD